MKMSLRWYGSDDKVTLQNIRQIPGMEAIVTAVYDVPVGEVWSRESIGALKKQVEDAGLLFEVLGHQQCLADGGVREVGHVVHTGCLCH